MAALNACISSCFLLLESLRLVRILSLLSFSTCTVLRHCQCRLSVFDWSPHPAFHACRFLEAASLTLTSVPRDFLKAFVLTDCIEGNRTKAQRLVIVEREASRPSSFSTLSFSSSSLSRYTGTEDLLSVTSCNVFWGRLGCLTRH